MTGRILIADEVSTNRIILKTHIGGNRNEVIQARTAEDVLRLSRETAPDAILMSEKLGNQDAIPIVQQLRAVPKLAQMPIVLMAERPSRSARIRAIQAGVDAILTRAPDSDLVKARLRNLLRRRAEETELSQHTGDQTIPGLAEPAVDGFWDHSGAPNSSGFEGATSGQIAVVASTLREGLTWRNGLSSQMRDRISVLDPNNASDDLASIPHPDAVVVADTAQAPDLVMHVISDLRSRAETLHSAVLVAQDAPDVGREIAALNLGASDITPFGFEPQEMAHLLRREMTRKIRSDRRRAALQDGLRLANTDPLTGLFNRRSALKHMDQVMRIAGARQQSFAVMVLDLDRFKSINDRFGHRAGDIVLTELSQRMNACLRQGDFMARIGGEEFLAVIQNCDLSSARVAAERLRTSVSDSPVLLNNGKTKVDVTISIGMVIAGENGAEGSAAALIDMADRGLYASKADGRNQVTVYQSAA